MVYLAYVESNNGQNYIVVTDLALGATSWPTFSNQFTLPTTGQVQSPEVLVEPNDTVDLVYVADGGIYLDHSSNPTLSYGWTTSPAELVAFQHTNASFPYDDIYTSTGQEALVNVPHYPSTAIATVPNGDTYLYGAYMDGNLGGDQNQPDGTFGIYAFQYDLTNPQQLPLAPGRVGQVSSVTDEWMPSLAISPNGAYAFIGFYGGNGVYNSTAQTTDEQYNAYYITGATSANGTSWKNPVQITNVNGGYFDEPGGPSADSYYDPPSVWTADYDTASADYQNFHYSFMETSNEQLTDGSGNQVTVEGQSDVYMANVPIPYAGAAPATPNGLNVAPDSIGSGTLTVTWNELPCPGVDADAYIQYSTDGQGWLSFGQPSSAGGGSVTSTIPNYSVNTTYYFRVRVQNTPTSDNSNADASSAWSAVVQSWTGATYTPDLWYYPTGTFTDSGVVHTLYNFDFAYPSGGSNQPIYGDLQWWDSSNERWDRIDHILLDSAGGVTYYFDPTAASGQSGVQISSSDQFRIRFENSSGGSTAWLQLYPNLQTPANAPIEPQYITAAMSEDGQTLEVTWDATGYDSNTTMTISVTGEGSEWWDPSTQTEIWLVQNAAAQDGSASISVADWDGFILKFQTTDSATGQVSDVVFYYGLS